MGWPGGGDMLLELCIDNNIDTYTHTIQTYIIYTYIHTYIHTYAHTYTNTYIHTYACTHIRIYIHTYVHTYNTYIHILANNRAHSIKLKLISPPCSLARIHSSMLCLGGVYYVYIYICSKRRETHTPSKSQGERD